MATTDRPLSRGRPEDTPDVSRQSVKPPRPFFLRSWVGVSLAVIVVAVHVIGWQVSQINPALLAEKTPRIMTFVAQVLQPEVVTRDRKQLQAMVPVAGVETAPESVQPIQSEVMETLPVIKQGTGTAETEVGPEEGTTERYNIQINVSAGQVIANQSITVSATGLRPDTQGKVLWQSTGTNAIRQTLGEFKADNEGKFTTQVQIPADKDRVIGSYGFPNSLILAQTWDFGNIYVSPTVWEVLRLIIETVFLALMGTTFAVIVSIPLSFLASHNLMSHSPITLGIYTIARTILNILRSIEVLILAVIFAATIGLGPFAGVLALTVHSIASLGKLYSEAIEAIDPGPIEAITATGANRFQVVMYAVVPQFIPQFISFTLYRWDINVRMSTVLGFVGGGGIGFILQQWINQSDWNKAATAIWAIAIVVIAMDFASSRVRAKVI